MASTVDSTQITQSLTGQPHAAQVCTQLDNAAADIVALQNGTSATQQVRDRARCVITTLGAGTCTAGVYTATANGAMAAQDGVTVAAGDVVFIQEGTTNLPTAQDAGPYVATSLGGASAPVVLTRPAWWAHGATVQAGTRVHVATGTIWPNSEWKVCKSASGVVGTDAMTFLPRRATKSIVLSSGTITVATIPLSAGATCVFNRTTPSGSASTVAINPITVTPGAIGTASLVINAQVAAGTINVSDNSTFQMEVTNW